MELLQIILQKVSQVINLLKGASKMMISEKCKTTYAKLNTFVTNVINRDVTPQITNLNETTTSLQETKLAKGDWTTLSNTESYVTTKADMITTNAWVMNGLNGETVTQTSIAAPQSDDFTYINNTNKKIRITLTWVSGSFIVNGRDYLRSSGDELTYTLNSNQSIDVISQTSSQLDYTVDTQSNIISSIIDVAYPVGSIYISSSTMHPSIVFGGVWERFAEDKFLLSAGSTYANGSTGGSANAVVVKHNHTQNAHNHTQNSHGHLPSGGDSRRFMSSPNGCGWGEEAGGGISGSGRYYVSSTDSNHNVYNETIGATVATNQAQTATNQESGVDGTGKNMPPYLAVFVWKRIA